MKTKKILKYIVIAITAWFIIHIIVIVFDGLTDKKQIADVAVILGNKVNKDGTLSTRLEKRLECGYYLYKLKRVKQIIVSGGYGKEGFFEAEKMKEYLTKKGIPDSLIIVDNYGNNTIATVRNSMKIKEILHFNSIIVVSQYYHVTRTKMLFKKYGLYNTSSCSPFYFEFRDIYSLTREFIAYYVDLILT